MDKTSLAAKHRSVLGKKVKNLRAAGNLPANIYGKDLPSLAIEVGERPFKETLRQAGETGIIYLALEGDETEHLVLIHGVQRNPVTGAPFHVDFYQVNLKEKTTANVPVVLTGENELEKRGEGLIIQTLNEIEVEALPADIPHEFTLDISTLTEIGQTVKVGDLQYDRTKVEVKVDPEENILVMQTAEMKEEVVEEVPAEGAEPEVISEEEAAARAAAGEEGVEAAPEAPAEPGPKSGA